MTMRLLDGTAREVWMGNLLSRCSEEELIRQAAERRSAVHKLLFSSVFIHNETDNNISTHSDMICSI